MLSYIERPSFTPFTLGQPPGQALDIQSTSELRPGDVIHVEFPAFSSAGFWLYGTSESFTVFGFDLSNGKIGVYDEDGGEHWFDGGTKDQLLSKLAEKTSYSSLTIIRPSQQTVTPTGQPEETGLDRGLMNELFSEAQSLLPAGYDYTPLSTREVSSLEIADLVYDRSGGERVLWAVQDVDSEYAHLVLLDSDTTNLAPVTVLPREYTLQPWQLAIRVDGGGGPGIPVLALAAGAALLLILAAS